MKGFPDEKTGTAAMHLDRRQNALFPEERAAWASSQRGPPRVGLLAPLLDPLLADKQDADRSSNLFYNFGLDEDQTTLFSLIPTTLTDATWQGIYAEVVKFSSLHQSWQEERINPLLSQLEREAVVHSAMDLIAAFQMEFSEGFATRGVDMFAPPGGEGAAASAAPRAPRGSAARRAQFEEATKAEEREAEAFEEVTSAIFDKLFAGIYNRKKNGLDRSRDEISGKFAAIIGKIYPIEKYRDALRGDYWQTTIMRWIHNALKKDEIDRLAHAEASLAKSLFGRDTKKKTDLVAVAGGAGSSALQAQAPRGGSVHVFTEEKTQRVSLLRESRVDKARDRAIRDALTELGGGDAASSMSVEQKLASDSELQVYEFALARSSHQVPLILSPDFPI